MITMDQMVEAAEQLLAAESSTAKAEQALKEAKEAERILREETIPGMFSELGIEKMSLKDGSTFGVKQEVYASIPEHKKPEVFAWLTKYGFEGIIKTEVQVPFGKGEIERAKELLDALAELGITNGVLDRSIHPQTLKAFLREQLEAAAEAVDMEAGDPVDVVDADEEKPVLDLELFGARAVMSATVKKPAAPRKKTAPRGQVVTNPGEHYAEGVYRD